MFERAPVPLSRVVPLVWTDPVAFIVTPWMSAVVVMLFVVDIAPKPLAIEPDVSVPVPVIALYVPPCRSAFVISEVDKSPEPFV